MWQDVMTTMLRFVINDWEAPQTYCDSDLETALLVGARFVYSEISFNTTYTANLTALSLSPDPTLAASLDDWMTNLTVMKTAILLLGNELRKASLSAWSFKDVDVSADLRDSAKVKKQLLDHILAMYEDAKMEFQTGVKPAGSAIMTPFNIMAGGMHGGYSYDRFRTMF